MFYLLQRVRESQNAKICLLLGFCFITTIIFLSRSGQENPQARSELLKTPSLSSHMSDEEETHPGDIMTGGLGKVYEKDDEVTEVVEKIKPILEEKSNKKFEYIEVIQWRPQTVAGKNYFVKAKAKPVGGDEQIIHLRIYKDIRRQLELTAFQLDKKLDEPLVHFQ